MILWTRSQGSRRARPSPPLANPCPAPRTRHRPAPGGRAERDEYVPSEPEEPSGRYWLKPDGDGTPKLHFDGPEKPEGGKEAERCTGDTGKVDREIKGLKRRQAELERRLAMEPDEAKRAALEKELNQIERELSRKDNDTYRRQHTVFS